MVHVDHLNRPSRMTDAAKAVVWTATWLPWGGVHAITGSASLDARLPGQWYQLEAGLHYNWHRHYDPSLGRYTQPDPLGFVDGPSVFGYAKGSPYSVVDPEGRFGVVGALGAGGMNLITQVGVNWYANGGNLTQAVRCVNWTNVAISSAFGFVGAGALDIVRGRATLGAYGASMATGAAFKTVANTAMGGPVRIESGSCGCPTPRWGNVLGTIAQ
jgi:RHS repeat-associated protein